MSLDRCPQCRELVFSGRHKCPPKWWIYCTDESVDNLGMEEPQPAFGHYPDRALEKWVGQFECDTAGERGIAADSEEPVFAVFSDQDYLAAIDEIEPWDVDWAVLAQKLDCKYRVFGEFVPSYSAARIRVNGGVAA